MKVVVAGGTGFLGRHLVAALQASGDSVCVLTRSAGAQPPGAAVWDGRTAGAWHAVLDGADAVVNLAGESIAARRWSPAQKARIRQSRLDATAALLAGMKAAARPPHALISASAVGYYGPCGDEAVTEESGPGSDFLAGVCVAWEAEARRAEALGVRVAIPRIGVVLARDGGALPRMLAPFRLGMGGPLGPGRQWMPWVHRDDVIALFHWLLAHEDASGPFNACAPAPVRNRDFAHALGQALGRGGRLAAPAPLLRLALGEMAGPLLLAGQRALPARAQAGGFRFTHPELGEALAAALG